MVTASGLASAPCWQVSGLQQEALNSLWTPADDFHLEEHNLLLPIISAPKVNIFSLHLKRFTEVDLYIIFFKLSAL